MSGETTTTLEVPQQAAQGGSALRQVIENSKLRMKTDGSWYERVYWTGDAAQIDEKVKGIQTKALALSSKIDAAPEPVQAKFGGRIKSFVDQYTNLLKDEIAVEDRGKKLRSAASALKTIGDYYEQIDAAIKQHGVEEQQRQQIAKDQGLTADFTQRLGPWKAKTIDATLGKEPLGLLKQLEGWAGPVTRGAAPFAEKERAAFQPDKLNALGAALDKAETATTTAREIAAERKRLTDILAGTMPDAPDAGVAGANANDVRLVLAKRREIGGKITAPVDAAAGLGGIEAEIGQLPAMLQTVRNLVAERRRLDAKLTAEVALNAPPGDIVAGAAAEDVQAVMAKRKEVATQIRNMATVDATVAVEGGIVALQKLVADVRAIVAERMRLGQLLEAACPANAKPGDLVPGAVAGDVSDVMDERRKIQASIDTPGGTLGTLAAIPAEIGVLNGLIRKVGSALAAVQKQQQKLQVARDVIAADEVVGKPNPQGCTTGQGKALDAAQAAVNSALKTPLTPENNTDVAEEVRKLRELFNLTNDDVKEKRKENDKQVQPVLRRLKAVEEAFNELRVADAWDLSVHSAYRGQIQAAQRGGDWGGAIVLANELDGKLKEPEKIAADMSDFRNNGKLLSGTYDAIVKKVAANTHPLTLQDLKDEVKLIYDDQCNVERQNWLEFLGVAGDNVKVGDPNGPHYTTFNNGVLQGAALATVQQSEANLCVRLFQTGINSTAQVHATVVHGTARYHKYWDGTYSNNYFTAHLANTNSGLADKLDEWHQKLVDAMTAKVREAIAAHGRIGRNKQGPQIT